MKKKNLLCIFYLSLSLLAGAAGRLDAQNTAVYDQPGRDFRMGVTLYQNGKYAAAKRAFGQTERRLSALDADDAYMREECAYYKALCDVLLYHKNGASALRDFVQAYPESNRVNDAYMQLADFEYNYARYQSAYDNYQKVDPDELDTRNEARSRYFFRTGYAAFMIKKYDDAKLYFSRLIDQNTRYTVFATYYYAYILYSQGFYQTALDNFEKIEDDPSLSAIIPLYMLQCRHMLGENEKVLEDGPGLMETAGEKRKAEIGRLLGEAYYMQGDYRRAIPYLNAFYKNSASLPDVEGCYILGYCYYQIGYYDSAVVFFQKVLPLDPEPKLKQTTLYHLAYCYLQQGNKKFAMDAFAQASRIEDANEVMAEDAAYYHAQLLYELGVNTYPSSISVFEGFLERYPNSAYRQRVYGYLVDLYMTTKDYDHALASIARIPHPSVKILRAEQRLLFNKGVEAYLRRAYGTALDYFEKAAKADRDEALTARANYWQGECYYAGGRYEKAAEFYRKFLSASISKTLPEYPNALFSMGYAAMEMVNYPLALRYWKEFLALPAERVAGEPGWGADAYVRQGDCLYMQEEYGPAVDSYRTAVEKGYTPQDYPLLQTALCYGAMGQYAKKVETLSGLERNFPQSNYKGKIWQELAGTYLTLEDNEKALQYYRKLRDLQPGSPAALLAQTRMGLIYFNQGNNHEALNCFKAVAQASPSTEEGRQALASIRNIYMSMNQIDLYFAYVKKLPHIKIEESEQDSLTYLAAENFYLDGDCAQALQGLKKYLDAYPEGIFMVDAWLNVAECAEKTGDGENLKRALAKLAQLKIEQAEPSARKLADIYYAEKEYKPALGYYTRLEELASTDANSLAAKIGKMRCYRATGKSKELISAALDVLRMDGVSEVESDEARYFIAQAAPAVGEKELSMQQYEILAKSKNPDYASEACYAILEQRYRGGFYDEAERLIYEYLNGGSLNDYYLAKVYLLWADIYYQRGNVLQAKQTLQSIADNYEGEDLRQIALDKLGMISQKENEALREEEELREERYSDPGELVLPSM